jgi:hypothetical protein
MTYEDLIKHLSKDCKATKVQCPKACGAIFLKRDAGNHFYECPRVSKRYEAY